jgi:potassium efflux system protein
MFRFATLLRLSGLALAAALVFASVALAQQAPLVGIDPVRAALDQIETTAKRGWLGVRALSDLSQQLPPMRDTLRDKLAELEPRLADLDARLKGLGPAPAKDAPPEDATIAAERTRLTQQRAEMDAAIKQVQLLQTRAAQLSDALSDRRRTAYAETLFQRSPNVLDPFFWRDVLAAMPDHAARLVQFARDWWSFAWDRGGSARMASAGLTIAALLVFAIGLVRWWRRIALISRVGTRYGKALAALLVFLRRTITTPLGVAVVLMLLDQFELVPPDDRRLLLSLVIGSAAATLARAAATSAVSSTSTMRRRNGCSPIWYGAVACSALSS